MLAAIWLGSIEAAPAVAAACSNAQFRVGPSEQLPDCRAFEQVSPTETGGLDAVTLQPPQPAQSSACEDGEPCTLAYMNVGAAFGGAPGNEFDNAYLATRDPTGWQTTPLSPPTLQEPANGLAKVAYAFSGDLSQAILRVPLQQLTEGAPAGVYNLFLRQPGGAYSLLTPNSPPEPPVAGCGRCFEHEDVPAFAGASSDLAHVIFEANDSLVQDAPGKGVPNLYETAGGRVQLVERLPDGEIPAHGAQAGGGISAIDEASGELDHAISADGSHVVFEAKADGGLPDAQQQGKTELYDRIDASSTVEISAPAPGAQPKRCETSRGICDAEPARFWAASADGSLVYFTSKAALTKESNTGSEVRTQQELEEQREREEEGIPEPEAQNPGEDLYRYDVDTRTLTDLTADAAARNGAEVLGVVGASSDGSRVYFVAKADLAGAAEAGEPNLYLWDGASKPTFIATLKAPDKGEETHVEAEDKGEAFPYESDVEDWTQHPTMSQAYVTPDGEHLAFMSVNPLTGYDNIDQRTGKADPEVYEYDAETGVLVCASCDAGDVPPLGSAFIGATLDERASTAFHQPRSLSDDGGRLFFSSPDPLVPGLQGGSDKLFEYENGAAQLISGSEAGGEAVFLDASASGDDVFFATREPLTATDADELLDVYDARVDGGLSMPIVPTPCQGSACQEPYGSPPSLAAPISAVFVGQGNLPTVPAPAPKPTRAQLLSRALAKCKKLKSGKKRSACIVSAKRRYGVRARTTRRGGTAKRRGSSRRSG
ncbi:MAG TPA: hypothetical protein VK721_04130 [Solirubrobacteraceae bacterium]|nr:hypothetical protein [Solirubrobacteraceae bacterium]